jgi:class 3 adenylate cyclase
VNEQEPSSPGRSDPTRSAVPGERRQATVLFADIVGFTAISERLGEEGTYALVQPIYELMAAAVQEQGGTVKDFTGDGIMALFGVPAALEDAPLRACRTALSIQTRLAAAAGEIDAKYGERPEMRIGINAGPVVVAQVRGGERADVTALGDTVNLASRLQTLADPGTVLLSEAAHRQVQGMVDAVFAGEHQIKGKTDRQKVYRLHAVREGAARFDAALSRGLTTYVGRERELEVLERGIAEAVTSIRIFDIVAEPGMGKSRLLHEFRQQIGRERAFILTGSCSPDGMQTPFLPFIEVIRGSFQVSAGEAEYEIARKLEIGLSALGLHSLQNLGLLLNLLGLKPPKEALTGLDGVLIGLRTRELLRHLLEARCRLSPVVLLMEDLHWIDNVSEEVLGEIVGGEAKLRLLLVHTRRPEYVPAWLDQPVVAKLHLEPLSAADIRCLVQARLGVEVLPEALARQVTEKAEGNALFAEEIVSFLMERGVLRAAAGKVVFDANAMPAALPASIQSLLTARMDQLSSQDRALLQMAAVIGRRFNPQLLAITTNGGGDINARLAAMQTLDLVYREGKFGDYAFKHALVRDALYQGLLTGPRMTLHLKIAEAIERRSGNRLAEVIEILAHHYSQTDRADKAVTYLAMAGAKCLAVYSFDEAEIHFATAIALLHKKPDCATDQQVAELLVDYALYLNLSLQHRSLTETVERFMPRLDRLGDSHKCVLVQHHYVFALLWSIRYRDAEKAQIKLSAMAARLHDVRSRAYALASAIHLSTIISPSSVEVFETLSREAIDAASNVDDPYLQIFIRNLVGWEEFHRGRMAKAHEAAEELMAVGRRMNDPRSMGFGMHLHSWVALTSDDYTAALNFAETSISIARTALDRESAKNARIVALISLRRPEAFAMLREWMGKCATNDWLYILNVVDGFWGVALVLHGEIGGGIRWIEQAILRREQEGYRAAADWYRMFLCEIYLEIIAGTEKPPAKVLARNILTLVRVMFTAQKRISSLVERVRQNPQLHPDGHHIGRCEMILGLLYKVKKKRSLAVQHLTEAKRIASQFGATPMLAKIDTALAELSYPPS